MRMEIGSDTRRRLYMAVVLLLFLVLTGRFLQLQIFDWDKYYRQSERNRIREVRIEAPRGLILDRHGEILVDNRPAYSVSVVPEEFLHSDSTVALLADILEVTPQALVNLVRERSSGKFTPVKIKRQVDFRVLSHLEERRLDLPGVLYGTEPKRYYPAGVRAPHLFGYLGEITARELARRRGTGYKMGDLIGKSGVELQYESYLRGQAGVHYVEVDALGREVRDLTELAAHDPVPGKNVHLTLDAGLQRLLEEAMAEMSGAAVVLDPRNGDVLAMVSKPDYPPGMFSSPLTPEIWDRLTSAEGKPLFNRACQSVYPPGSTFKLVLAMAALESGGVELERKVLCTGTYRLGWRNFDCWKAGGHGEVDMIQAIEQSCNVYFYTIGLEVGVDLLAEYARQFNFDQRTRIDLPNEGSGLVPDRTYLDARYGKGGWTRGLMLNMAVGQGDLLVTPLQMAYMTMIIANEGVAYTPNLVRRVEDPISGAVIPSAVDSTRANDISAETYKIIKGAMWRVVNGEHGTGRAAFFPKAKACGKTGTAQNPHGEDHAWFVGFAPMERPRVAFAILVENGGSGGAVAAPIARQVLACLFGARGPTSRQHPTDQHAD